MERPPSPFHQSGDTAARYGKFACVEKLGAGGMGEVWKAWDSDLMRWVALKFLKGDDTGVILRFQREAQLAAGLSHPHIAAVYDVGHANGRHYIAMQYVDGTTLKNLPGKDRKVQARLIRDAARGVAVANARGIIHRDLKPENIMVGEGGHVFVMDFGLARCCEGGSELSVSGEIFGTPGYMPPEQARGEKVDERADVYGLGGTLYQVLTGRAPFRGANILETLRKVLDEDPVPPRKIDPKIDPDLETIVLKCLEKDSCRRYATASALADDLDKWIEGEAIAAHRPSMVYRLRKTMAKRKALLSVGLLGAAGIAMALAILLPRLTHTRRELELWTRIAGIAAQADMLSRAGELEASRAKLDEGIRICDEALRSHEFPHGRYFLGRLWHAWGNPERAMAALDRALVLDPDLGEARFERGLVELEELLDAIREVKIRRSMEREIPFEELARSDLRVRELKQRIIDDLSAGRGKSAYFEEADEFYGKAELARIQGRYGEARAGFEKALAANPLKVRPRVSLCEIARESGNLDEAFRQADLAVERDRSLISASHSLSQALEARGQYDAALAECSRIIKIHPREARTHRLCGTIRYMRGDYSGAIGDFDAAERLDPRLVFVDLNRGLARFALKDYDGAIRDFSSELRKTPDSGGALCNRGVVHEAKGDPAAAMMDYNESILRAPHIALAWAKKCGILQQRKQMEEFSRCVTEGLERFPDDPPLLAFRGILRMSRNDLAGALADFNRSLELNPTDFRIVYNRAVARSTVGDTPGAITDFDAVIRMNPRFINGWVNRGAVHARERRYEAAESDFDQALKIDPIHTVTLTNRASVRTERGNLEGALADFTKLIQIEPSNPQHWIERAKTRFRLKDRAGTITDLEETLKRAPPDWPRRREAEEVLKDLRKPE